MNKPTRQQQLNQQSVMQDELVGQIHDRIFEDNQMNLADAYNQACCEIAELYRALETLEQASSSGYSRKRLYLF